MQRQLNPEWSCLPTYINFYHFCQHLLTHRIFKKPLYRQLIIDEFNKTLKGLSLTQRNIYEMFSFAYQQNLSRYSEYFIGNPPTNHCISQEWFCVAKKYMISSFVRYNKMQEIKYPLTFPIFQEMFTQELRPKNSEEQHEVLFKELNLWGCGYVNLNEVPIKKIPKIVNPYVHINSFIDLHYPKATQWRKINPPSELIPNRTMLIKQLLSAE